MRLENLTIRTHFLPGDPGYIAYLHGVLYSLEYGYSRKFEGYVLEGLAEFVAGYDPDKDHVWMCEDQGAIIGFLAGVGKQEGLQLRYFLILPEYRGLGLGRKLMKLFIEFMREKKYDKAFLWTTNEQQQAASLYTRFGFVQVENKPSEAFGKPLVEQRYVLVLEK